MHWTVILSALTAAVASAYLVFVRQWSAASAFLTVCLGGILALAGVVGVVMLLARPGERPEMLRQISTTMRRDFADVLSWLRFRK